MLTERVSDVIITLIDLLPAFASILAALIALSGAIRAGAIKTKKSKSNSDIDYRDVSSEFDEVLSAKTSSRNTPFEIEQLANYYSLSLGQAKISFWFSLIFASVGFLVIIGASILFKEGEYGSASIKILSGIVIDSVAALFFIQSRRAQESMASFFEKLRNDRQFAEARKICDEIVSDDKKDAVKTILALHYSGLDSSPMIHILPKMAASEAKISD